VSAEMFDEPWPTRAAEKIDNFGLSWTRMANENENENRSLCGNSKA